MSTTASAKGRTVESGINWVWYITDTRDDAFAWFAELTGKPIKPEYEWVVCNTHDGRYGFRLRRS